MTSLLSSNLWYPSETTTDTQYNGTQVPPQASPSIKSARHLKPTPHKATETIQSLHKGVFSLAPDKTRTQPNNQADSKADAHDHSNRQQRERIVTIYNSLASLTPSLWNVTPMQTGRHSSGCAEALKQIYPWQSKRHLRRLRQRHLGTHLRCSQRHTYKHTYSNHMHTYKHTYVASSR